MRKWMVAGASAGVVAVLLAACAVNTARSAGKAADDDEPRSAGLPVSRVLLFSSGVGHFLREGSVAGDARVDLSFPAADINDLIKSMVVRDLDGGHVTAVSYDSQAPIDRTLKSFAVDLTTNPTLEGILNQARGERVEVVPIAAAGAAAVMSGAVVGVERQKSQGKDAVDVSVLNLWCADGLRSVKLSDVQRVKFLSPQLESEFKKALDTLALSHDTQKKSVAVRCVGEGKRRVQVGYVVENPVWKTSYRLVLGTKEDGKAPYLQGWAVVENATDEDWKDVRMGLISGRPISFQMDLYQPLFVARPTERLELFASLRPVAYSGRLDDFRAGDMAPMGGAGAGMGGMVGGPGGMPMPAKAEPQAAMLGRAVRLRASDRDGTNRGLEREMKETLSLGESVASAATAAKLGDFFQYAIDKPVSLPRQKSALLPIVGKDVEASRVSIYNERVQGKFPLLGLRFKNTSGLHLMQGPITIFEGGTYAGDAVVRDLQPGEERLVSYAVDLGTEVNPVVNTETGRYLSLKAVKGILHTTSKTKRVKTYQVKNRNDQPRSVLVEHPVDNAFKLVGEKPKETASDVYRFELAVGAGERKDVVVSEEREERTQIQVTSEGDERIRWFISQPAASDNVKKGLTKAVELRLASTAAQREGAELTRQLKAIEDDQTRLRANLMATPATAAVYKKYLAKLDAQEEQIEKLRAEIEKHKAEEHAKKKAFDDFLANFNAE